MYVSALNISTSSELRNIFDLGRENWKNLLEDIAGNL